MSGAAESMQDAVNRKLMADMAAACPEFGWVEYGGGLVGYREIPVNGELAKLALTVRCEGSVVRARGSVAVRGETFDLGEHHGHRAAASFMATFANMAIVFAPPEASDSE